MTPHLGASVCSSENGTNNSLCLRGGGCVESAWHDVWHPAGAQRCHFFSSSQLDTKHPEARALLVAYPSITWAPGPVSCIREAENKPSLIPHQATWLHLGHTLLCFSTRLLLQLPSALGTFTDELPFSSPLLPTGQGAPGSLGNQYLKPHG